MNVLMIGIETCRKDALGCYNPQRNTPFLNEFAKQALVFDNYFTTANNTYQSWGCIFTGQYAHNHGISTRPEEEITAKTMDKIFHENGYYVRVNDLGPFNIMGVDRRYAYSLGELREPFFYFIGTFNAHGPYGLDYENNLYTREQVIEAHAKEIEKIDNKIQQAVTPFMKYKDTIIVIVADHGDYVLENGYANHCDNVHDRTINVPLLIYHPHLTPRRVDGVSAGIDLLPTILGFCGLQSSQEFDGINVSPYLVLNAPFPYRTLQIGPNPSCEEVKIITTTEEKKIIVEEKKEEEAYTRTQVLVRYQDYRNREYVNSLFQKLEADGYFKDEWGQRAQLMDNLGYISDQGYLEHIVNIVSASSGMFVLDVGSGTGQVAKKLAEDGCFVTAVDQCYAMLEKIPASIDKRVADVAKMLFIPDESMDRVICRMVLHSEFDRLQAILNEMYRVLKYDGLLVISEGTPMENSLIDFYRSFLTKKEHREMFTQERLLSLLQQYHSTEIFEYVLKKQSIKQWLANACMDKGKAEEIFNIHKNASQDVKTTLNMIEGDDDIFCDFKFTTVRGIK